jgi:RNA polymerase sigma-B factor
MRTEGAVRHASGVGARKPACADFAEYQRTKDRRERDRLFEAHTHLAYTIARRFAGRGEDMDDLRQVALLALVQAIERFDPSRGLAFSTFATPTIAGSLKRHFRDRAWAIRPPRPVQERYLEMNAVLEGLTNELCRAPTVAEIATHGNWSKQQVSEALAARGHRRFEYWGEADQGDHPEPGVIDERFSGVEDRHVVDELLGDLGSREREVVKLRFVDGLAQSVIGTHLGVSQMQVSRLLATSLKTLRTAAVNRALD